MKLPRDIYGVRLAGHLRKRWGYQYIHQSGSHIILVTDLPFAQRISIPAHKPLKVGIFGAIVGAVADHKMVSREEILRDL